MSDRRSPAHRLWVWPGTGLLLVAAAVLVWTAMGPAGSPGPSTGPGGGSRPSTTPPRTVSPTPSPVVAGPFRVGRRTVIVADHRRLIYPPHSGTAGPVPRTLVTQVWYPAVPGSPRLSDNARPDARQGPFPLVVFAPGFDLYPAAYGTLLQSWARAGYVVAGVTFPLTNPGTLGGPDEADIVNEPRDLRFLVGRLLRRDSSRRSFLHRMIDPSRVGIAGHSDGGTAVLASAFDSCCRDRRVRAAIVMSGAELRLAGGTYVAGGGPPLLAIQGSADAINLPSLTREYFSVAGPPKYLLWLHGAGHLTPYTAANPFEAIVRRVTIEFLDRYLKRLPATVRLPRTDLASLRRIAHR